MNVGDGILAVHGERVGAGPAQGGVQDGTVLGDVDVLPGVHGVAAGRDVGLFGELEQGVTYLVGEQVLGQVDVQVGRVQAEPLGTRRIGVEPPTHDVRTIDEGGLEVGKCGPGRSVGGINRCLHGTQRSWSVEPMWSAVTQPSAQRSGSSHVPRGRRAWRREWECRVCSNCQGTFTVSVTTEREDPGAARETITPRRRRRRRATPGSVPAAHSCWRPRRRRRRGSRHHRPPTPQTPAIVVRRSCRHRHGL